MVTVNGNRATEPRVNLKFVAFSKSKFYKVKLFT